MMEEQGKRTLTDADVKAITDRLQEQISDRFVRGAGWGILRMAWRGLILAIIALAVYGWSHTGGH